jgi:hypothetical protein
MDIKKFMVSDIFNSGLVVQKEIQASRSKNDDDAYDYMFDASELKFMNPCMLLDDIVNDENIKDFEDNYIDVDSSCISYTGPMIKRYFDVNAQKKSIPIKNYYIVNIVNNKTKVKDIIKKNMELMSDNGYYIINTDKTQFRINKKTSPSFTQALLSETDSLNRICIHEKTLWMSSMFIMELYKKLSTFDNDNVDPVFNYPEDIFDIYMRSCNEKNDDIKQLIDMLCIEDIQKFDDKLIQDTMIQIDDEKYTVIEYVMLKLTENTHSVIIYQYRNILMHLTKYTFFRPPHMYAKLLNYHISSPGLYSLICAMDCTINFQELNDKKVDSMYHINMTILYYIIKYDNDDIFVDYITKIGIVKKFISHSKTADKIIDLMIEHNSVKIISLLVDSAILSKSYKYKLIFLTQHLDFLGNKFIEKYVTKKNNDNSNTRRSDTVAQKSSEMTEHNNIDDETREIILCLLPHIINKGLTRSFYMITKLCVDIIDVGFTHDELDDGGNILHMIQSDNACDILEIILKKNKKLIDEKDDNGKSPLIKYSQLGLSACISKLLQYEADYELTDNDSDTYLHKLCRNGYLDIVKNNIRNTLSVINYKNDKLMTPAMIAAKHGHEEIFYVIRGLNADLDIIDIYGNTVYHYICESHICPSIMIINKKNKYGFTPYDYSKLNKSFYYYQNIQ